MNKEPELDSLVKRMAEEHRPVLPSPDLIWWRAQLLKKYEQKRRIERPGQIMRLIAALVCLAYAAALWVDSGQAIPAMAMRTTWLLVFAIVVLPASLVSASLLWVTAKR